MYRDPLIHLILIGLVLYLSYSFLNPETSNAELGGAPGTTQPAQHNSTQVNPLGQPLNTGTATSFSLPSISPEIIQSQIKQTRRSQQESSITKSVAVKYINDEILLHNAYRLGLHDDAMIRERLINKAKFALEGQFVAPQVSEDTLRAFYKKHQTAYKETDTITFEQTLIASAHYAQALALIRQQDRTPIKKRAIKPLQKRAFISSDFNQANQSAIKSLFGEQFLDQIKLLPLNRWQGLVHSKHGKHLVKVTNITLKPSVNFEAVKSAVKQDWLEQQRTVWFNAQMEKKRVALGIDVREYMTDAASQ